MLPDKMWSETQYHMQNGNLLQMMAHMTDVQALGGATCRPGRPTDYRQVARH
jgi:hypothetical protein